jgi:hypothetical protein
MTTGSFILSVDSLKGLRHGTDSLQESIPLCESFLSDTLRKRERAHVRVLDEKSIPAFKIEVSWAMGDSIPHSVSPRFLICFCSVPSPHCRF